jgi:hypothetical protein
MQNDQAPVKPARGRPDSQREGKKKAELAAMKMRNKIEIRRLIMNRWGVV